ncbi:MAG: flagellar biosynthesis anti-sigma factor FlgM [Erysipelotrichaceae bacterium]
MKIQTQNVQKAYGTIKKVEQKTVATQAKATTKIDTIEVSKQAQKTVSVHTMTKQTIQELHAETSSEKLDALKAKVQAGTYHVKANDIAKAMQQYLAYGKGE